MSASRLLSDAERLDWLRLTRTESIGPSTFFKLIQRYKTAAKAIEALPHLLSKAGSNRGISVFPVDAAEKELAATAKAGATLVAHGELQYPEALLTIETAPAHVVHVWQF